MRAGRIRLVELAVAASVVVISIASLGVALYQGRVMERTLAANVWPSMQFELSNFDQDSQQWRLVLSFSNQGVGPAQMRDLVLRLDGETLSGGVGGFLASCCAPEEVAAADRERWVGGLFRQGRLRALQSTVSPRVFAPGQSVEFVTLYRPDETDPVARALWEAADEARRRLEVEICYCSVFEDCWRTVFKRDAATQIPLEERREVESCAVSPAE